MAKKDEPLGFGILEAADKHLEGISDITLLILKAHLLIEEELYNQVRLAFPNPQHFDAMNPRFIQVIQIGHALCIRRTDEGEPIEHVELCWDALEALNTIRNKMAHNLQPPDLSAHLSRLQLTLPEPPSLDDPKIGEKLNLSFGFLLQFVSSLQAFNSFGVAAKPGIPA